MGKTPGNFIDLTGQKFNRLQVLERDTTRQGSFWVCKCDCGNITSVASQKLRLGYTKSCGCYHKDAVKKAGEARRGKPNGRLIDLTGKRFGKLLVLEQAETKKASWGQTIPMWRCKCDCGNETIVSGVNLRLGKTNSCGCLIKDKAKEIGKSNSNTDYSLSIGQRFGKLVTIKELNRKNWLCKCDCGSEIVVNTYNLVKGATQSCGCVKSRGEEKVAKLLEDNNIKFVKQQSFNTCVYKKRLSFDFYVNNEYLIEYDGAQHFEENLVNAKGWFTEEGFEKGYKRDMIKNDWCKENSVPLIRIPYTHLDNLCIDDLRLETTKFRIC